MSPASGVAFFLRWLLVACFLTSMTAQAASIITYYHNDLTGSPLVATDASGHVLWRESYRPYGERLVNSAAAKGNDVWFTSRRQDVETGLVYMGARYYDPVAGRFASIDPKGFDEANVLSFGRYMYANDNPYKYGDPSGRDAVIISRGGGAFIIEVPIAFSGPGATKENMAVIRSQVERAWTGTYDMAEKKADIAVRIVDGEDHGVLNTITLTNGPTSERELQGASFVRGTRSGEWDVTRLGTDVAAHETGHLMGLRDRYTSGTDSNGNRVTSPYQGSERSIMGVQGGTVGATDMEKIFNSPANKMVKE